MIKINNIDDMESYAKKLADIINKPVIICLNGDLGVGKTSFASAFIKSKIKENIEVTSPTFAIIHEYNYIIPIAHLDLYRLNDLKELYQIGIEDYLEEYISLIEWPEIMSKILPSNYINIVISFCQNSEQRNLQIEFIGKELNAERDRFKKYILD